MKQLLKIDFTFFFKLFVMNVFQWIYWEKKRRRLNKKDKMDIQRRCLENIVRKIIIPQYILKSQFLSFWI